MDAHITIGKKSVGEWWQTITRTELHNLFATAVEHGWSIRVAGQKWDR